MEYKRLIIALITEVRDDDVIFLNQIYTMVKRHVEKTGVIIDNKEPIG